MSEPEKQKAIQRVEQDLSERKHNMTQVIDTFFVSKLARRLADLHVEIAAEVMINRAKMYNPAKLGEMCEYMDRPDYPWISEADNKVFWRTYHRLVRNTPDKGCDGKPGYVSSS
jgi:hypothetical protein